MADRSGVTRAQFILDAEEISEFINDLDTATLDNVGSGMPPAVGDYRIPLTKTFATISKVTINPVTDIGTDTFSFSLVDRQITGPRVKQQRAGSLADLIVDIQIDGIKG